MILVTGATGQLGTAVVRQLLARTGASDIAVLARDPGKAAGLAEQGVSVRAGDYDDTGSLARAMDGLGRVLLIASGVSRQRTQQHQNVIDAARAAGVELLGFTSRSLSGTGGSQNAMMRDYVETEARIGESGVPAVIFRNAQYLDTLPVSLGGAAVFKAGIRVPAGQGRVAYALRREMGEATANAMLDHSGGGSYVLAGPRAHTFGDVAEALSEISGAEVSYASVGDDEFVAHSVEQGMPEPMARYLVGFFADVRANQLGEISGDLAALLGREPVSLKDGLAELFAPLRDLRRAGSQARNGGPAARADPAARAAGAQHGRHRRPVRAQLRPLGVGAFPLRRAPGARENRCSDRVDTSLAARRRCRRLTRDRGPLLAPPPRDGHLAVGRLGQRSDADLAWETDLLGPHRGRPVRGQAAR